MIYFSGKKKRKKGAIHERNLSSKEKYHEISQNSPKQLKIALLQRPFPFKTYLDLFPLS